MTAFLSCKIKILSFFSMILVVLLHSNLIDYSLGFNRYLQLFITESIARIAVPLFFIISGYLFFIEKKVNLCFFKVQYSKRIRSLLVPYCIWCLVGYFYLYIYNGFNFSFDDLIQCPPKSVYQLWFLKDLIICVIISPILYILLKKLGIIVLPFLFMLVSQYFLIEGSSVFDFSLGAYIALHKYSFVKNISVYRARTFILGIFWFCACLLHLFLYESHLYYLNHLIILLGISFIWNLYNILYRPILERYKDHWAWSTSFFIYLFHEPLLSTIKKTMLCLSPSPTMGTFLVYICSFLLTIILCLSAAYLLNKHVLFLYKLLTGGRIIR